MRCNPRKLLLDPYARATAGQVRIGPEVFGYAAGSSDGPSPLDSAAHVPRSLVVDPAMAPAAEAPAEGRRGFCINGLSPAERAHRDALLDGTGPRVPGQERSDMVGTVSASESLAARPSPGVSH